MRFLLKFLFILLPCFAFAQSKDDSRENFDEGDYFFAREEFSEAAYYFRKLIDSHPENSHFNFRLGECYMNIPGSEKLAIPCFEKAVKRTVEKKKYKVRDFNETFAPLHAWFYLGNVYRMTGKLNEALHAYDVFINSPEYYGNYNINVVENEIASCERAKIVMDSPVDALIEAVDTLINTTASESFPVLSADERTMVFVRKLRFYDAILWVTRQGSSWSQPVNLNPLIGSDGDLYPVSLSSDGNALYLLKNTEGNKDIYVSYRLNDTWTHAESLGKAVNSMKDETWASISADGQMLWFTSARKGGQGGLDIYYARRDKNNRWSMIRNAGKMINTPFDEESPCITQNDQVLFFSSKGHDSMGGFDIFYAMKDGKTWKAPVNIGYPVNNTLDNTGYFPLQEGKTGYYSFIKDSATSSEDVYRVVLRSNYPLP